MGSISSEGYKYIPNEQELSFSGPDPGPLPEQPQADRHVRRARAKAQDLQLGVFVLYPSRTGGGRP